jgi:hypothetical protein
MIRITVPIHIHTVVRIKFINIKKIWENNIFFYKIVGGRVFRETAIIDVSAKISTFVRYVQNISNTFQMFFIISNVLPTCQEECFVSQLRNEHH